MRLEDSRLSFLDNSLEFVVFTRLWWDGNGIDCLAFWMDSSGCHKTLLRTGEVTEYTIPTIALDEQIEPELFHNVIADFISLGMDKVTSQDNPVILSHHDDWYGIKARDVPEHWAVVRGGKHSSADVNCLLDAFYGHGPLLVPS